MNSNGNGDRGHGLSLDELVEAAGLKLAARGLAGPQIDGRVSSVPDARTVRYYTTLGLVDRPAIVDRQARYGDRHVRQLVAIKALQTAGLPLGDIQTRLYARTDEELDAVITSVSSPRTRSSWRPAATRWVEIVVEPGIRLLVDESRLASELPADLTSRLRDAIESIRNGTEPLKEQQ